MPEMRIAQDMARVHKRTYPRERKTTRASNTIRARTTANGENFTVCSKGCAIAAGIKSFETAKDAKKNRIQNPVDRRKQG